MSLGRRTIITVTQPVNSKGESKKRRSLMAKLRLDDIFKKATTSNFKTAEQFFENYNNGFLPATTLSHPDTQRSSTPAQPKFKTYKLEQGFSKQQEESAYNFLRFRRPTLRETFYIFCNDKEPNLLNTRTVIPSSRSHRKSPLDISSVAKELGKKNEKTMQRTAALSLDKRMSDNGLIRREIKRVRKIPYKVVGKGESPVCQSISAWNWLSGYQDNEFIDH